MGRFIEMKNYPHIPDVCPEVEEVQSCLHQAQKNGQDPGIQSHWFSPVQSLSTSAWLSLCSYLQSNQYCVDRPRLTLGPQ